MKITIRCVTVVVMLLSVSQAFAQQRGPVAANEIEPAYPGLHDREALVEVEFTVRRDGSISEPVVVGGFYEQRFLDATLDAVNALSFQPAMDSGQAVDWPGYRVSARYIIEDLFHTVHPAFGTRIKEVESAISDGNYPRALELAEAIQENDLLYFYEYAYVNTKLSEIYLLTNRLFEAQQASMLATQAYRDGEHRNYGTETARMRDQFKVALMFNTQAISDNTIVSNEIQVNTSLVPDNTVYQPTLQTRPRHIRGSVRFSNWGSDLGDKPTMDVLNSMLMEGALFAGIQIQGRTGHFRALYNDYERLANIEPAMPDGITQVMNIVNASTSQDGPLQSSHRLDDHGNWLFFPYRRTLAVINVDGRVDTMDFQCESRVIRLAFVADSEWGIPDSWGDCAIRFRGEPGTTFSAIEFAD